MSGNFKDVVRQYIASRSLREDQLQHLQSLLAASSQARPDSSPRGWNTKFMATAAVLVVALVSLLTLTWPRIGTLEMAQRIAEEVASNHLHAKPLEIQSGSMGAVRGYFDQLGFAPVETQKVGPELSLLGGRYCSLQGVAAAQLRLRNTATGAMETLYETEYRRDVFGSLPQIEKGEKPIVTYARGIQVTIWVEKDIVFALTREPPP